jgi:hypothetical protein
VISVAVASVASTIKKVSISCHIVISIAMASIVSCTLLFISFSALHVQASEFLRARPQALVERLSQESIRTTLLEEIEGTLGTSMNRKRNLDLEAQLRPIFAALPKNVHGGLDHATVRYALHRLFVSRHGWNIKGLAPNGERWNSSSPVGVLKDQAPAYIHSLFEERLGSKGLGLHELVIMAATIEHMIHNEAIGRLGAVFNVHKLLPTGVVTGGQATAMLDTYMAAYISAQDLTNFTTEDAYELVSSQSESFSAWHETQDYVHDILSDVTAALPTKDLDFASLVKTVEVVGENYGRFQNTECTRMKSALVKIEDRGNGRVKLADFYNEAKAGVWGFLESVAYLRELGALDETDRDHPSIIIANYLQSETNCIASSGFYSVCCMNEGEELLAHIEEKVGAPEATPGVIAALVANLVSSSVQAPRELPATLLKRLEDIAATHGGMVPLHSRLFGQWMHHAFPREFPFPHMSGTTSQQSFDEFGGRALANEEEISQFSIRPKATDTPSSRVDEISPWSHEEELLVPRTPFGSPMHTGSSSPLRKVMLLLAAGSAAYGVAQMFKSSQDSRAGKKDLDNGKYFV